MPRLRRVYFAQGRSGGERPIEPLMFFIFGKSRGGHYCSPEKAVCVKCLQSDQPEAMMERFDPEQLMKRTGLF